MHLDVDPALIRKIKLKMKQADKKEQVKALLQGLSRADLQNRTHVKSLMRMVSQILNEPISAAQLDSWSNWIVAQRINPNNKLHLLRLWSMFA